MKVIFGIFIAAAIGYGFGLLSAGAQINLPGIF